MHFDEEMGFQFLCPRSTVLSPSDPRPPTVLLRLWPLTIASKECALTLGILLLVDLNLLNSSFVSPLPLSLTQVVVPASHPTPLPLLLHLCCLTMHFPTLFIFVLHRPDRSSSAMVYGLDVNHPAPPLPLLRSSHPPLLILFLSLEGTHSVVTLTLVLSLISTKCSWITSPSLSTLRTIATAPTLFPFPRNISLRPFLSIPGEYNKLGLLLVPLGPLHIRLVLNMFLPLIASLKPSAPPPLMLVCKLLSLALSPTNQLMTTPR